MKQKQNILTRLLNIPKNVWRYILSWLTMKKVYLFYPTMSGNIYIYKDCYNNLWLAYPDFPKMRSLYENNK